MNYQCWMIEMPQNTLFESGAGFWCGHRESEFDLVWSASALDAVRFVRKQDAANTLRIIQHYLKRYPGYANAYDKMYVAEHGFVDEAVWYPS